jgi:hypothetical protein
MAANVGVFLDTKVEKVGYGRRLVTSALVIAHGVLETGPARSSASMSARPRPKRSRPLSYAIS